MHLGCNGDVVAVCSHGPVPAALHIVQLLELILPVEVSTRAQLRYAERRTCCWRRMLSKTERCMASLAAASSISCCRCSCNLRSSLRHKERVM